MNTTPEDEEKLVRVAVPFEHMRIGETFTICDMDRRMQSLLGAGYLETVTVAELEAGEEVVPLAEERPKRGKGRTQ